MDEFENYTDAELADIVKGRRPAPPRGWRGLWLCILLLFIGMVAATIGYFIKPEDQPAKMSTEERIRMLERTVYHFVPPIRPEDCEKCHGRGK